MSKYDILIVLTADYDRYEELPLHPPDPSLRSKMRTLGALEMVKQGFAERIIFCGGVMGKPAWWKDHWPSHAEGVARYFAKRYPSFPPEKVIIQEENALDTADDARNTIVVLRVHGLENATFALITSHSHLRRAVKLFRDRGVPVTGFAAEALLRKRSHHHRRFVKRYFLSWQGMTEEVKELILRCLLIFDQEQKIARWIASHTRRPG